MSRSRKDKPGGHYASRKVRHIKRYENRRKRASLKRLLQEEILDSASLDELLDELEVEYEEWCWDLEDDYLNDEYYDRLDAEDYEDLEYRRYYERLEMEYYDSLAMEYYDSLADDPYLYQQFWS